MRMISRFMRLEVGCMSVRRRAFECMHRVIAVSIEASV